MRLSQPVAVATLLFFVPFLACKKAPEAAAKPAPHEQGVVDLTPAQVTNAKLKTAAVEAREASGILRAPATLAVDPTRSWRVAPVAEGVIEEVRAAANDIVTKGQVVARLRSAALGDAQVAWIEARANLRIANANRERNLGLRQQAVVSEAQWLQVDAEYQRAKVALAQANHKLALAGMSSGELETLESSGRTLGKMALTSPARGVVLASHVTPGQALSAGENAFEIADLSHLWVIVHIPVSALGEIKPGAKATVTVAGGPQQLWNGVIGSISGSAGAADQTVEARVVVANAGGFLRPGMYADVEIGGAPVRALMAPSSAIFNVGNQSYVFRQLAPTRFKAVPITAAPPVSDWTPISGPAVEAGMAVVTDGVAELKSHWLYAGGE